MVGPFWRRRPEIQASFDRRVAWFREAIQGSNTGEIRGAGVIERAHRPASVGGMKTQFALRRPLAHAAALLGLYAAQSFAAPGDLDWNFGLQGRTFVDFQDTFEYANDIVSLPDGRLLLAREVVNFPIRDAFSVVRLTANGSLDMNFGNSGRAFVVMAGTRRGVTLDVLPLASRKIIAAGYTSDEGGLATTYGLARYQEDGAVDTTFGQGGYVTGNPNSGGAWFSAVVELPDGRLVAAGTACTLSNVCDMAFARFNANGSIDSSFGNGGQVVLDFFGVRKDDSANNLVLLSDGKLVASGSAIDFGGTRHVAMVRLLSDGTLDATFGTGGRVSEATVGIEWVVESGLQRLGDGRLVMAGQARDDTGECSIVVSRYNADGSADLTFGTAGVTRLSVGSCDGEGATALESEPGGAVLVGYVDPRYLDARVARLAPDGMLDETYGRSGTAIIDVGFSVSSYADTSNGVNLVRQNDGKIALTTSDRFDWWEGGTYFTVARIGNGEGVPGHIGFTYSYASFKEGESTTHTVRRTGGSAGIVSVTIDVRDNGSSGTAADVRLSASELIWLDGETADKTITVEALHDGRSEGVETLTIALTNATGGAGYAGAALYVGIEDLDPPPPPPPSNPNGPVVPASSNGGGALGWLTVFALALAATGRIARRNRGESH
jgi:uncharacterized delta-60 repeat protein